MTGVVMRKIVLVLFCILFGAMNVTASEGDLDGDSILDSEDDDIDGDGMNNTEDDCPLLSGLSTQLEVGCPDYDADGIPDHLDWNRDGDSWDNDEDDCPMTPGSSKFVLKGCKDIDGDFMPDIYDDDADGDGIRNEMERAASTGLVMYDPYNFNSVPPDFDEDTIPDVLDDDADNDGISNINEIAASRISGVDYNHLDDQSTPPDYDNDGIPDGVDEDSDNDGWPDYVEIDRGSSITNENDNPHDMYFGVDTGFFYYGGLTFGEDYDGEAVEFSLSGLVDILTEELVIPLLLIPIYLSLYIGRKRLYNSILSEIEFTGKMDTLSDIENKTNELVKTRKLKVYHGLVLRNAIEQKENLLRQNLGSEDSTSGEEE